MWYGLIHCFWHARFLSSCLVFFLHLCIFKHTIKVNLNSCIKSTYSCVPYAIPYTVGRRTPPQKFNYMSMESDFANLAKQNSLKIKQKLRFWDTIKLTELKVKCRTCKQTIGLLRFLPDQTFALTVSFAVSLPARLFALPDFLFAVLTQTSLMGGLFRGAYPLASERLSDSSVPQILFSSASRFDTLSTGNFAGNWISTRLLKCKFWSCILSEL